MGRLGEEGFRQISRNFIKKKNVEKWKGPETQKKKNILAEKIAEKEKTSHKIVEKIK